MQIIDGKKISAQIKEEIAAQVSEIVANGAEVKTEYFMTSESFISTLNGLSFDNIWVSDDDDINEGFPVFKWEKAIY